MANVPRAFVAAVIVGLAAAADSQSLQPRSVRAVDNDPQSRKKSVLLLTNGQRFQTTLYEVRALAELPAKDKLPFVVMAGRDCVECDEHTSIYIHSPSDGPMSNVPPRNSYPGRIVSYLDGKTPVSETRVFIGACVPAYENAVVWYQRWPDAKGKWHSGVVITRVAGDRLDEILVRTNLPAVADTLKRVRRGVCREIPGVNGTSEP